MREALRGSHHDYTAGPLGRAIVLLAIPMVAEMIMESVFAVWDVYWVNHIGAKMQIDAGTNLDVARSYGVPRPFLEGKVGVAF